MRTFLLALLLGTNSLPAADPAERLRQADALDARHENSEALPLYLEAEQIEPGQSETLRKISKQYGLLIEQTDSKATREAYASKALAYAKRAVEADPNNAEAHLAVAISYGKASFLKGPKERLAFALQIRTATEKALELAPDHALAHHVLGRWHYEIATLNPALKFATRTLFGPLPEGSLELAIQHLGKAAGAEPGNLLFAAEYGRALAAAGDTEAARTQLEIALALPPEAPDDPAARERAKETLEKL